MGIISEIQETSDSSLSIFSQRPWQRQKESEMREKPKVKWFIHVSQNRSYSKNKRKES